ncbi:MAG: hypothetical protein E6X86_01800 [Clostridium butyricum]|nr:hypothetical protein [Clostridium butyricum]MDU4853689.1 hypothetical protein [Clostridioides difficile]
MGIIKRFSDDTSLEYGQGSFDGWCVYIKSTDGKRKAPRDIEYFNIMKRLSVKYGPKRMYSDFLLVYNKTSNTNRKRSIKYDK